jgi:hypothetical protein
MAIMSRARCKGRLAMAHFGFFINKKFSRGINVILPVQSCAKK